MRVFIVAPGNDRERDRSFSLETLVRGEVDPDYPGQLRSAAMSPDHQSLAVVGGWFSARDKRGHNGIFLLRYDKQRGDFWRLESWFDVRDLALGDIAFGPGGLLLVTSRPHRPESATPPQITLFDRTGERLGSFIPATEGSNASHALESRLTRVTENTYGLFDPHSERVRFLRVADNRVTQEREVPLPFPAERLNVVGFDPRPDGRVVIARTIAVDHQGKTFVTVLDPSGRVLDEWQPERSWRYGYADEKHVLHGFESAHGPGPMSVRALTVR